MYVINLDEFKSIETQWIALYLNDNSIVYFDSFGVKHSKRNGNVHRKQKI